MANEWQAMSSLPCAVQVDIRAKRYTTETVLSIGTRRRNLQSNFRQ